MTNPLSMSLKEFRDEVGATPDLELMIGRILINHPGVETLGEFAAVAIAEGEANVAMLRAMVAEFSEDAS